MNFTQRDIKPLQMNRLVILTMGASLLSFACGDPLPPLPLDLGAGESDSEVNVTDLDQATITEDQGTDQMRGDLDVSENGFCQVCDTDTPCPNDFECFNNTSTGEQFCTTSCDIDNDCPSGYRCGVSLEGEAGAEADAEAPQEQVLVCVPDEGRCEPKLCRDEDGDGYGRGPDCLGLDCADDNPEINEGVSVDLCDNVDNDCDGLFDENFAPEACGEGVCQGQTLCDTGRISCDGPEPMGEDANCNAVDEDCDGSTDEAYQPISCGLGACSRPSSCVNGEEQCNGAEAPAGDEDLLCDRIDSDCDGVIDEGYSLTSGTCGMGVCTARGSCGDTGELCEPLSPLGNDDNCNGLDDDCDGSVDEGFSPLSICGLGACRNDQSCTNGVAECQVGPPIGEDTTCDDIDDDCNGVVDDLCADNFSQLGFSLISDSPTEIEIAVTFTHSQAQAMSPDPLIMPLLMNLRFRFPTSLTLQSSGMSAGQALIDTFASVGQDQSSIRINNIDLINGAGRARFIVPTPQPFGLDYIRTGQLLILRFTKSNAVSPLNFEWVTDGINSAEITNQTGILPVQLNDAAF